MKNYTLKLQYRYMVCFYFIFAPLILGYEPLPDFILKIQQDCKAICSVTNRTVGSCGHDRVVEMVLDRIKMFTNVMFVIQEFDVNVPLLEKNLVYLEGENEKQQACIYPFWPSSVRMNCFGDNGCDGKAVYVKDGSFEALSGIDIRDAIAVMEITGGGRWRELFDLGIKAVVALGNCNERQEHIHSFLTDMPRFLPRFYLPDGEIAEKLRKGEYQYVKIRVKSRWNKVKARNIYACIKGSNRNLPAIYFVFPLDAISGIVGYAPGADNAIDLAFGLYLLERFSKKPPASSLIFIFVDAFCFNQVGLRLAFQTLRADRKSREDFIKNDLDIYNSYRKIADLASEIGEGDEALNKLSEYRYRELHAYIKNEISSELNYLEKVIPEMRSLWYKRHHMDKFAEYKFKYLQSVVKELADFNSNFLDLEKMGFDRIMERLIARSNKLKAIYNQIVFKSISEDNRLEASMIWRRVKDGFMEQLNEAKARLTRWDKLEQLKIEILKAIDIKGGDNKYSSFIIGIDLSDSGIMCGPLLYDCYWYVDEMETGSVRPFIRWLTTQVNNDAIWVNESVRRYVSLGSFKQGGSVFTWQYGNVPTLTGIAPSFGGNAVTWATLESPRFKVDTFFDNFEYINWENLYGQLIATVELIDKLCNVESFKTNPSTRSRQWTCVFVSIVDKAPGDPVPKVPVKDFLVTLTRGPDARHIGSKVVSGIRNTEIGITGKDGCYVFDNLPTVFSGWIGRFVRTQTLDGFYLDDNGNIIKAVNTVQKYSGLNRSVVLSKDPQFLKAQIFDSVEAYLPVCLMNLRQLTWFNNAVVIDAIKKRQPEYFNLSIAPAETCCFIPPYCRWQLVLRRGKGLPEGLLLGTTEETEYNIFDIASTLVGFSPLEKLNRYPAYVMAQDIWRINENRIRKFKKAGIRLKIVEEFHNDTLNMLKEAEEAHKKLDIKRYVDKSREAVSSELRVYEAVRDTADDVIRAAIFLLIGLIPFSVIVERLLFASSRIYEQILISALIIIVMSICLWVFHPAFKITQQPIMLLLAFILIFLSGMVIILLIKKFKIEVNKFKMGYAEYSGADIHRGGLIMCALTVGIATMRKRLLRTILTGITVALITFTVMSFSSTSIIQEFARYELKFSSTCDGILIRHPGKTLLTGWILDFIKATLPEGVKVIPRYWLTKSHVDEKWLLHIRDVKSGKEYFAKGALLLEKDDAEVFDFGELFPDWINFYTNKGCYIPESMANSMGISTGTILRIAGIDYRVTGVYSPKKLQGVLVDMLGDPVSPLDYSQISSEERQILERATIYDFTQMSITGENILPAVKHCSYSDIVILPARSGIYDTGLYQVFIPVSNIDLIERFAEALARRIDYPVFYSKNRKVFALSPAPLIPRIPRGLLVPLCIGGLIVFNTIMNSIAERKKEIYIYTSLGLAPLHIGAIFMAEALTYAMIGSVFGFVVGQAIATICNNLGLMGNLVLNYSGTHVIFTILLVVLTVCIGAIVPAYIASRIASPGEKAIWSLPPPKDDVIEYELPFTATGSVLPGIFVFLYRYFDAHRDGVIGCFSCSDIELLRINENRTTGIRCNVWMEPYDLGVREEVFLYPLLTDEDIYTFVIVIKRKSGKPKIWFSLNKAFVSDIRRQLLGWRKVALDHMIRFIEQGRVIIESNQNRLSETVLNTLFGFESQSLEDE